MTDLSKAELKKRWGTMQKVVSSEPRARQIVDDILLDMETKPRLSDGRGNAMLTSEPLEASVAERIAGVFAKATIRVPALAPMSGPARIMFVNHNLYEISRDNLSIALGPTTSLALDVAREANEGIYRYILGYLGAYLAAIHGTSATVDSGAVFISTIEDVLAADAARLSDVIQLASADCAVMDLTDPPKQAWWALAEHKRFPPTFSNVSRYVTTFGQLDANLARVLAAAGTVSEVEEAMEDEKARRATTILASREVLPAATLHAALVASLQLTDYIDASEIVAEDGELFALLIRHNVVQDTDVTYAHLSETDWTTRERIIHESAHFGEYMTPALVQGDLAQLLVSGEVHEAIKVRIIEQAGQYVTGANKRDLAELAGFAVYRGQRLDIDVVETLAANSGRRQDVVILMEPRIATLGRDRLFGILRSLGGDYAELTSVGHDTPRIPNTPVNTVLLERLKQHGIVSTFDAGVNPIKVNKKRK